MAKVKKLTKEEIEAINKKALEKIETIEVKRGRKSDKEDFLNDIKEVLKKALDKQIPFTQISKLIKELYSIDVSVNVVKSFAKKHLNYVAKERTKKDKNATAPVKDKDITSENKSDRIKANINEL